MVVLRRFALLLTVLLSAVWRAAAEAEGDHASYNLGVIYENGRGAWVGRWVLGQPLMTRPLNRSAPLRYRPGSAGGTRRAGRS